MLLQPFFLRCQKIAVLKFLRRLLVDVGLERASWKFLLLFDSLVLVVPVDFFLLFLQNVRLPDLDGDIFPRYYFLGLGGRVEVFQLCQLVSLLFSNQLLKPFLLGMIVLILSINNILAVFGRNSWLIFLASTRIKAISVSLLRIGGLVQSVIAFRNLILTAPRPLCLLASTGCRKQGKGLLLWLMGRQLADPLNDVVDHLIQFICLSNLPTLMLAWQQSLVWLVGRWHITHAMGALRSTCILSFNKPWL